MSNLKSIISGWSQYLSGDSCMKIAIDRAKVCATCESITKGSIIQVLPDKVQEIQGMKCQLCRCPLSAKTRSLNEKCPVDKW